MLSCCRRPNVAAEIETQPGNIFTLLLFSFDEPVGKFPVVNWQDWHGVVFSAVANLLQGTMCCVFKDAFPQHTSHVAHSEQPTESSLGGPERKKRSGHWGSLYGEVHIRFAQRNSM